MHNGTSRYLDLLADTLLDNIYGSHSLVSREAVGQDQVANGTYWPLRAHTMIGKKRLENIRDLFVEIVRDDVPGDLIETGVWRGGACIYMKALVETFNQKRKVYVADSFEGLPNPDARYPADANPEWVELRPLLAVSLEEVRENFKKYNLLDDDVIFVKGFFEHSLSQVSAKALAMLRLDGDMYSSTIQVLDQLYERVSNGGFIVIDDFHLDACRAAIHDFRVARNIQAPIIPIDWAGAYWRKQ